MAAHLLELLLMLVFSLLLHVALLLWGLQDLLPPQMHLLLNLLLLLHWAK